MQIAIPAFLGLLLMMPQADAQDRPCAEDMAQYCSGITPGGGPPWQVNGLLPDDLVIDKVAMKKLVQEKGIDTLFVAGPKSRKNLQTLRPGQVSYSAVVYADPDDGFFAVVSGFTYKPGTYAERGGHH
jgi:hypothetical protein